MADEKFSEFTAATSLDGTEKLVGLQGGANAQFPVTLLPITVKVSISSAEILALNATPKVVQAAPGAGNLLFPVAILWKYTFGTTPYATNLTLRVRMGGTMMSNAGILNQTGDCYSLQPLAGGVFALDISNTAISIDVQTGNPTAGDGTLEAYLIFNTIAL